MNKLSGSAQEHRKIRFTCRWEETRQYQTLGIPGRVTLQPCGICIASDLSFGDVWNDSISPSVSLEQTVGMVCKKEPSLSSCLHI